MKPRLLDLFCGAGGCTKGYQEAGFYVVGVDRVEQSNYCGDEFVCADALDVLQGRAVCMDEWEYGERWLELNGFDAISASPPCQSYSRALRHLAREEPRLIETVRESLAATGLPFVVENVPGAPLPFQDTLDGRHGVELCGSMFGLEVRRHRLFETSFPISAPRPCDHRNQAMNPHNQTGRNRIYARSGRGDPEKPWREEMGVSWMRKQEGREAIPPAYTRYIGEQLLAHITQKIATA